MNNFRNFKNYFLAATGMVILTGSLVHAQKGDGKAATTLAPSNSTQNVKVVNTSAEPVPVTISGTSTVQISYAGGNPLLTRDVDNAARQPFQIEVPAFSTPAINMHIPQGSPSLPGNGS